MAARGRAPSMPTSFELSLLCWLAVVLAALALVQTARLAWLRGAPARACRRRLARAARGESAAEALVERLGFRIVAVQPEFVWRVHVDGAPADILLRPDLLVEYDGRTFVADVKTGGRAPDPLHPTTRRQLLEYRLACGVDGALVVDVEAGVVRTLDFALFEPASRTSVWPPFLLGSAFGTLFAAATGALAWALHY